MTRRETWQRDHRPGCPGGPLTVENDGPYRATVCGSCGVPVVVSYPALPDDGLVPEPFQQFIAKQLQRIHPH